MLANGVGPGTAGPGFRGRIAFPQGSEKRIDLRAEAAFRIALRPALLMSGCFDTRRQPPRPHYSPSALLIIGQLQPALGIGASATSNFAERRACTAVILSTPSNSLHNRISCRPSTPPRAQEKQGRSESIRA